MKGSVLGFDAAAQATVIRAEDGRRYSFSASEWRERLPPRKADGVDFEPDGNRARAVFLDAPDQAGELAAAGQAPAAMLARLPGARLLLHRPVLLSALLVLVACLFGAYQIDGAYVSVLAAPELISRLAGALDGLVSASASDAGPRLGAGVARLAMALLLLLYAVPALAALAAWRDFIGRPNPVLAQLAGLAAMVLPLVLPLVVVLIVRVWVIPGVGETPTRLGRGGLVSPLAAFDVLRLYATGTVFLIAAGAALWAAATGRFRPLSSFGPAPSRGTMGNVVTVGAPQDYAPLRSAPRKAPVGGTRAEQTAAQQTAAALQRDEIQPPEASPAITKSDDWAGTAGGQARPAPPQSGDGLARLAEEIRTAIEDRPQRAPVTVPPDADRRAAGDLPPASSSVWPKSAPPGASVPPGRATGDDHKN